MSVHPDTKQKREFKFQPDQRKYEFSHNVVGLHNLDIGLFYFEDPPSEALLKYLNQRILSQSNEPCFKQLRFWRETLFSNNYTRQ